MTESVCVSVFERHGDLTHTHTLPRSPIATWRTRLHCHSWLEPPPRGYAYDWCRFGSVFHPLLRGPRQPFWQLREGQVQWGPTCSGRKTELVNRNAHTHTQKKKCGKGESEREKCTEENMDKKERENEVMKESESSIRRIVCEKNHKLSILLESSEHRQSFSNVVATAPRRCYFYCSHCRSYRHRCCHCHCYSQHQIVGR